MLPQEDQIIKAKNADINNSVVCDTLRDSESERQVDEDSKDVRAMPKKKSCNCTPFVLMIALSVHATFEGIALGLQMTMAQTLNIVVAVVIHKGAASSALGISLVKVFPNDFTLVRYLILIFSFATPLGVVIGILAAGAGDLVDIIMSSLAAGTFIYIACTEIVVAEFNGSHRIYKLIAFISGACIISSLSFIPGA